MEIRQINESNKGAFKAYDNKREVGILAYTWENDNIIVLNHTEVNPHYEGKGIGKKLIMHSIEFARQKNLKIILRCPYAKKVFERTAGIQDVLLASGISAKI